LEDNSHDLDRTYKHIAEIYKKQKKFDEASVMLNKCHALEAAYPPSEDFNLENVNIDALFAKIFRSDNNA
jgi:endonuclease IV